MQVTSSLRGWVHLCLQTPVPYDTLQQKLANTLPPHVADAGTPSPIEPFEHWKNVIDKIPSQIHASQPSSAGVGFRPKQTHSQPKPWPAIQRWDGFVGKVMRPRKNATTGSCWPDDLHICQLAAHHTQCLRGRLSEIV
ncbi:hypothetical protein J1614_011312 [Plenodomus biglobosus]|nr:hypothetical protein J1614_011312 [Plenodomus biglobosus]